MTQKIPVFIWNHKIAVVNKSEDKIICPHCGNRMVGDQVSRYFNLDTHKIETFVNSSPEDRDDLVFKDYWYEWSCPKCGFGQHSQLGWEVLKGLLKLSEKERKSVLNRLSFVLERGEEK